jgi:hypothetical protein
VLWRVALLASRSCDANPVVGANANAENIIKTIAFIFLPPMNCLFFVSRQGEFPSDVIPGHNGMRAEQLQTIFTPARVRLKQAHTPDSSGRREV